MSPATVKIHEYNYPVHRCVHLQDVKKALKQVTLIDIQHHALLYVPTSRSCVTQLPHSYLHHVQLVYPIVRPRCVEFAVCQVRNFWPARQQKRGVTGIYVEPGANKGCWAC